MAAPPNIPGVQDAEGFYEPSSLGFEVPEGYLKMRIFGIREAQRAHDGTDEHNFFHYAGIENGANLFKENFCHMPGVIWSACLGSVPIQTLNVSDLELDRTDLLGEKVRTLRGWIQTYLQAQCANVAAHLYYYTHANNWGGLAYYLDITENTYLTAEYNVREILGILRCEPHSSILESNANINDLRDKYGSIIDWLIGRTAADARMPLWKIACLLIYTTFRRFKHGDAVWQTAVDAPIDFHDYNLRIYLLTRRGRFLQNFERGPAPKVALDHMPPLAVEGDMYPKIWLSLSQYYRLMSTFMAPFNLADGRTIYSLRRFVTRDAHASTSSSLSALYDRDFFDYANAAAVADAGGGHNRLMMFGINPGYKTHRHAHMLPYQTTMVRSGETHSLGVLAGVCWYYNHNKEERLCNYPVFKLPFDVLEDVAVNGSNVRIPSIVHARGNAHGEITNLLTQGIPNFFSYGVDEYILSMFVSIYMSQEAVYNEIKVLFYSIYWLMEPAMNASEYLPLMNTLMLKYMFTEIAAGRLSQYETWSNFSRVFFLDPANRPLHKVIFETFFGNMNCGMYKSETINVIPGTEEPMVFMRIHSDALIAEILQVFGDRIGKQYGANPADILCILDSCTRYDRPFYWNMRAGRTYAAIANADGTFSIPSNRLDNTMLKIAIDTRLPFECIQNHCAADLASAGHLQCHSGRARAYMGGTYRRTRKRRNVRNKRRSRRSKY
jgi:hypothetical protein